MCIRDSARWEDEARTAYDLCELPADHLTVNQAVDVYDFVYEQGNRPVLSLIHI